MSRRSNGRSSKSRGERAELRKEVRRRNVPPPPGPPTVMQIPDAIRALDDQLKEDDRG